MEDQLNKSIIPLPTIEQNSEGDDPTFYGVIIYLQNENLLRESKLFCPCVHRILVYFPYIEKIY